MNIMMLQYQCERNTYSVAISKVSDQGSQKQPLSKLFEVFLKKLGSVRQNYYCRKIF